MVFFSFVFGLAALAFFVIACMSIAKALWGRAALFVVLALVMGGASGALAVA